MANAWIITSGKSIASLVAAAREIGGAVNVIAVGDGSGFGDVDSVRALPLPEGTPVEAMASAVASVIEAGDGDIIFAPNRPAERVLAGAVAAKLGAAVITGYQGYSDGLLEVSRYGGISSEKLRVNGSAVVIMDGGASVAGAVEPTAVAGEAYEARVASETSVEVEEVNLAAAKRIVAVGRGFKAQEDLSLARDLGAALGAELACSRPLAEGSDWMPKSTYIGVSGQHVSPDIYVAVGISGQLQHSVGAAGAKTIIVVNSDANAPYFADADYGITGDLYSVLPALTEALK